MTAGPRLLGATVTCAGVLPAAGGGTVLAVELTDADGITTSQLVATSWWTRGAAVHGTRGGVGEKVAGSPPGEPATDPDVPVAVLVGSDGQAYAHRLVQVGLNGAAVLGCASVRVSDVRIRTAGAAAAERAVFCTNCANAAIWGIT